jgi:hypothetical protein
VQYLLGRLQYFKRTVSITLCGDVVGTMRVNLNPACANKVLYSAAVRSKLFTNTSMARSRNLPSVGGQKCSWLKKIFWALAGVMARMKALC